MRGQSEDMGELSFLPAFVGFGVGAWILLALDRLIPHLYAGSEHAERPNPKLGCTVIMVPHMALG